MKLILNRSFQGPLAALAILLTVNPSLHAHNETVHMGMTDLSYEIMLGVERAGPLGAAFPIGAPPGVPAQEWADFIAAVRAAPNKIRQRPSDLPLKSLNCDGTVLPADWAMTTLGQVKQAVSSFYIVNLQDCGAVLGWTPGGIFDSTNPASDTGKRDFSGTVLGFWAASVDNEFDDTHLWIRPTSVAGQGMIKEKVDSAIDFGLGGILIPFVCLWQLIFSDAGACATDAMDAADAANPIDDLEGLIPGVGDFSGADYVGMWHHIKLMGAASNEFDDHQGLLIDEAGPFLVPDPLDFTLMAAMDLAGMSVNHDESLGPARYQISGANDGQPDTKTRSKSQWQYTTIVHTPFEPVDNLAFHGWRKFRDEPAHSVKTLGWPLHALGDATVPMHVAGTSAWGHRPFEDAYELLWVQLRMLPSGNVAQAAQARAILLRAFEWRKFILNWRAADATRGKDVPVRDLVTALAQNTANYSSAQVASGWPFHSGASAQYLVDETAAINIYQNRPDAVSIYKPVMEDGMGATIAFLISAVEVLP